MVGLALMAVTFGGLWGMFFYDNKRITASMGRLTALRSGEAIVEVLKTDLKNLVLPSKAEYEAWGKAPLLMEATGSGDPGLGYDKATLYRAAKPNDPTGPRQKIVYRYDAAGKRVMRGVDGKESQVGEARVEDFLLFFRHDRAGDFLTFEVVTSFEGISPMGKAGENVQTLMFRGEIDLVDRIKAAERFHWVPSAEQK